MGYCVSVEEDSEDSVVHGCDVFDVYAIRFCIIVVCAV